MKLLQIASVVVLLIASGLVVRSCFPKVVDRPVIIHDTVYDTVKVDNPVWLAQIADLKRKLANVRPDTVYKLHETVTPPETVLVVPKSTGISTVFVPDKVGDSTIVTGFRITPIDTGYGLNKWRTTFYTPGPLAALTMDGDTIEAAFYLPAPASCGFWCKSKYAGGGGLVALAGYFLLHGIK